RIEQYQGTKKTIVLDEAQLYEREFLEYIRLLADSGKLRFVLSMHQNSNEELRAKEHFETRIFDSIKIERPPKQEFLTYIQKRLLAGGAAELAHSFGRRQADAIYDFCKGNFRRANQFLYTLFDILEYYEQHRPSLIKEPVPQMFVEMSAIYLGYIDE
ncbi:MAG: AAA family ATPase, partial [Epsilonproteobacteria bacterium]|nr:AAA family ATPase [Campylobacterota bacterium]